MKITLQKSDYEKILSRARECYPEEACGLIAGVEKTENGGTVRKIEKVYLLTNLDHSRVHFSMDPQEQLAAVVDMRANGLKPLGNWHSHPDTPSRPSEEDKRLAFDSGASYMILSLMDADAPVLNSFHIESAEAEREDLELAGE